MRNFPQHVKKFFDIYKREEIIELYNEFSVYYRLGNHLENLFNADYKIQFMRDPNFFGIDQHLVKPTIDIAIFDDDMDVRHAIEVVYIKNEPQLEKMFEICTGLRFMEQIVENGWNESYVLLIADIPMQSNDQLHYLFRGKTVLEGTIQQPTNENTIIDYNPNVVIELRGSYTIDWIEVDENMHYAVIPVRPNQNK